MKKWMPWVGLMSYLTLVISGPCFAIAIYRGIPLEDYRQAAQGLPIGRIDTTDFDGKRMYGSGSLVDIKGHTVVITAAHVLYGVRSATFTLGGEEVSLNDWKVRTGTSSSGGYDHGIAVAFLNRPVACQPFTLDDLPRHTGSELYAVGGFGRRGILDQYRRGRFCTPNGKELLVGCLYAKKEYRKDGTIFFAKHTPRPRVLYNHMALYYDNLAPYRDEEPPVLLECSPLPGDSGGPFFNPEKRTIYGVMTQGPDDLMLSHLACDCLPAYIGFSLPVRRVFQVADWLILAFLPSLVTTFRTCVWDFFRLPEFSSHGVSFAALNEENRTFVEKAIREDSET